MDPFVISGNSLGARDWDGRSSQWYTGSADSGHWEDINCGAHFKYDMNSYLSTAGTKYKSVQVTLHILKKSPLQMFYCQESCVLHFWTKVRYGSSLQQ